MNHSIALVAIVKRCGLILVRWSVGDCREKEAVDHGGRWDEKIVPLVPACGAAGGSMIRHHTLIRSAIQFRMKILQSQICPVPFVSTQISPTAFAGPKVGFWRR